MDYVQKQVDPHSSCLVNHDIQTQRWCEEILVFKQESRYTKTYNLVKRNEERTTGIITIF